MMEVILKTAYGKWDAGQKVELTLERGRELCRQGLATPAPIKLEVQDSRQVMGTR
jgi:hypothetical protein